MIVLLGNPEPIDSATRAPLPDVGPTWTEVHPFEGCTPQELLADLNHPNGIWQAHSAAPTPSWVASTDPDMAQALALRLGCPVRDLGEVLDAH